ncbi:MAG: HlyC/CorC family transporter [Clostridia bacterium]|nr:HlyC/CorC family transporter [Clostridia bacterium]
MRFCTGYAFYAFFRYLRQIFLEEVTVDSYLWTIVIVQVILIALNAFFAGAEAAIIAMNDSRIAKLAEEGDKRAKTLARLTGKPSKFLATIQVAITLAGFLGSAFAADAFSDRIAAALVKAGVTFVAPSVLDTLALVVITVILSFLTIVFGELVPKRIAMKDPEKRALRVAGTVRFVSVIFAPFVWILTVSTNAILRICGIDPNADNAEVSEEDIRIMVDVGSEKGTIDDDEKEFIQNVFEFDDLTAGEIATHRTEIELLWLEESMDEWRETIYSSRHTRYPICSETVDNVVGILNARDYFRLDNTSREDIMSGAVKPAYFVPETVKADVLFRNMKSGHSSFAVVLDEYGGMTGIVTMNDLIERLVGNLNDEEATEEEKEALAIEALDDGLWKITGNVALDEIEKELDIELPTDEYDTFSGLVFGALGSIPDDGSEFEIDVDRLSVKVTEVAEHQIRSALVRIIELPDPDDVDEEE